MVKISHFKCSHFFHTIPTGFTEPIFEVTCTLASTASVILPRIQAKLIQVSVNKSYLWSCKLVSQGCHNKLPKAWFLKHRILFSHSSWARSLKPRFWQGCILSRWSRENLFFTSYSFWWLPAFLLLCLHCSNLCLLLFCLFLWVCYKKLVIEYRAHLSNPGCSLHLKTLNLIISAKTVFPNKVTFTDSGD